MTLLEAINRVDAVKPNGYSQLEKIVWLSNLDGMIHRDIIETHEGWDKSEFEPYGADTPLDTELIVEHPYDDLYCAWLELKIDYANGEYDKYNNSAIRYGDLYKAYENDYNRHHKHVPMSFRYF